MSVKMLSFQQSLSNCFSLKYYLTFFRLKKQKSLFFCVLKMYSYRLFNGKNVHNERSGGIKIKTLLQLNSEGLLNFERYVEKWLHFVHVL
jgi:hypothetical protein